MSARAFLSHSSADKPLVEAVAKLLGRHRAVYDRWNFEAGQRLIDMMAAEVEKSDLFVLFASRSALDSHWVGLETRLAEELNVRRTTANVLVLITDASITAEDIPKWLKPYLAVPARNPNEAVYRINRSLSRLDEELGGHPFIGRAEEFRNLQSAIIRSQTAGHVYCVSGYLGIGREALADNLGKNFLRLGGSVVIVADETDSLRDIVSKMAEYAAAIHSGEDLLTIIQTIQGSAPEALAAILRDYMKRISDSNRLLILRDEGGILDSDGRLNSDIRTIVDLAQSDRVANVALVTRRALNEPALDLPRLRLQGLKDDDMRDLVTFLITDKRLQKDALEEIVHAMNGYAPNAYMAAALIRDYGDDYLLRDKRKLVDFQATKLLRELQRDRIIEGDRRGVLETLLAYSPLPYAVLEKVVAKGRATDLSSDIAYLEDFGFVVRDPNGHYTLSRPLTEPVSRAIGFLHLDHAFIARALKDYVDGSEGLEPSVDLYRCLYRAITYARLDSASPLMLSFNSDLVTLQERTYHLREYRRSIEFGNLVLEHMEAPIKVLSYLAKAYSQIGEFGKARNFVGELRGRKAYAEAAFVAGLLHRREGDLRRAQSDLEQALSLGKDDVSLFRELAFVRYNLDDLDGANKAIATALIRDANNRYVLDLVVQIALRAGDFKTVDETMPKLERVDAPDHFLHRESDVAYRTGDYSLAYEKARQSIETENPPLYFYSQLIKSEIALRMFEEAEADLKRVDEAFPRLHHDIKIGLRVNLLTKRRRFADALQLWNRLHDKNQIVHRALKINALTGLAANLDVAHPKRKEIEREIAALSVPPEQIERVL